MKISEQEDILFLLNLYDDYMTSFIKNDVRNDNFAIETRFYRSRKDFIKTYKALQILGVERKFEVFIVISKSWVEKMNNEFVVMLVRTGMVLPM